MTPTTGDRIAWRLLALHGALIVFSTTALVTFLAGAPPAWLLREPAQTVYIYGWRLSGPSYVIAGALAALVHAAGRIGGRRALAIFIAGAAISLAGELVGTTTGLPFGPYSYTPLLGYRVLGLVPYAIPLSWFFMVYSSLAILGRVLPMGDDGWSRWRVAALGGLVLTAWDVSMDPAMTVATTHWIWHTSGFFYGMPLSNWFGWWVVGSLVARAMLAIVPPTTFERDVSPSNVPVVLYVLNGIMPVALCIRHGLTWAAVFGMIAMAIPVALALRSSRASHRSAPDPLPAI